MHSSFSLVLAFSGLVGLANATLPRSHEAICANDGLATFEAAQATNPRPSCDTTVVSAILQVSKTTVVEAHSQLLRSSTAATTLLLSTTTAAAEREISTMAMTYKNDNNSAPTPSEIPTASLRIASRTRIGTTATNLAASLSISRVSRIRSAFKPAAADDASSSENVALEALVPSVGTGFTVRLTSAAVAAVTASSPAKSWNQPIDNSISMAARSQTGPQRVSTPFIAPYATEAVSWLNGSNYSTEAGRSAAPKKPLATLAGVAPSVTARVPTSTSASGSNLLLHLQREPAAARQLQLVRVAEHVYGASGARKA